MADKYDYTTVGFDEFFHRASNDVETEYMDDTTSQTLTQLPATNITGDIKIENMVTNLTADTGISTATTSLTDGSSAYLTTSLTDQVYPDRLMVGVCEITCYQGTTTSTGYAIPYGASVTAGHTWYTAYDYQRNVSVASKPGKSLSYLYWLKNDTGGTLTYTWIIRWRYVGKTTPIKTS